MVEEIIQTIKQAMMPDLAPAANGKTGECVVYHTAWQADYRRVQRAGTDGGRW